MGRLTLKDRRTIAKMYADEESALAIAIKVGVHPSTIYDEINRGYTGKTDQNGRREYDPDLAQKKIQESIEHIRNAVKKRS